MAKLTHKPQTISDALEALEGRKSLKIGNNTLLERKGDEVYATLHGHEIVRYAKDGTYASWAGWPTVTTRDRLNQLAPARFNVRQREGHINGVAVNDTDWYRLSPSDLPSLTGRW